MSPSRPDGFNPLRWKCEEQGCFNLKKRPKIEVLSVALPGRIAFSDVDAIVEINGLGLMLEWKDPKAKIPTGQHIMYSKLTRSGALTVFVVHGDAETMEVTGVCRYANGSASKWYPCNMQQLLGAISRWATAARMSA